MAKEATIVATRPARRGSGGRPTREEAVRRDARLLDVATKLFMERGFDGCVYRKLKSDYNGDEVRQGWRVNE
jgi:hypothetical protein